MTTDDTETAVNRGTPPPGTKNGNDYKVFHMAADIKNRHGCSGKNGFLAAFMLFSYFFHTYPFENVFFWVIMLVYDPKWDIYRIRIQ